MSNDDQAVESDQVQRLFDVTLYFKNGARVTARVSKWVVQRNRLTGELQGFRWTDAPEPGGVRFDYMRLDEIQAVTHSVVE